MPHQKAGKLIIIHDDIIILNSYSEVRFVHAVTAGGSVKIFTSGVNFSRNNAIYNINKSTKYI